MNRAILSYLLFFLTFSCSLKAQNSVLSSGNWAKIGTTKQGIYKLTGAQLNSLGFALPIASNQLQLFSFNISSLSDKVPSTADMGLSENAIKVLDGGDGQINAADYILFFNQGPVYWKFDSVSNRKIHINYTSADTVYYFIKMGQNGKRIGMQDLQANSTHSTEVFNQHVLFEKDTISLLNSGKTWYGTPLGQGVGKQSTNTFAFSSQWMNRTSQLKCYYHLASTSYQVNGQFDFFLNDQLQHTALLSSVSGMLFDDIAAEKMDSFQCNNASVWPSKSIFKIGYNSLNTTSTGWIDYIELLIKKPVGFGQDSAIEFSIEDELVPGITTNCKIQNIDASTLLWNVTNVQQPQEIKYTLNGNSIGSFNQALDSVSNFFAIRQNAFEIPSLLGPIANQNTFQYKAGVDYVIITAPAYMNAAIRYQQFQISKYGRKAIVVNAKEIYNDFSGGQSSPIALRNFLKTLVSNSVLYKVNAPKYLLLLGIGNFNARKINIDFELPTYESMNSNSILSSYTTDDFFAILNNNEDINNYKSFQALSLSVGRLPARTIQEADSVITKLINYQTNKVGGLWENKITWVADDGDYNLHLQDAESIISHLQRNASYWDHNKIYLDFFPAVSTTSGNTYPMAFNAIQQAILSGTKLINYTGHGNYLRLSEEAVIAQSQFDQWNNASKLPLMVTASCNFAPYDQPSLPSIAWDALMKNRNGIVGLVAANRLVFAYSNKQINDLFIQQLLVKNKLGQYPAVGDALQQAKNISWTQQGDKLNDLKFNLMGDPALQINLLNNEIVVQKINDHVYTGRDTLLSGNSYNIQGVILKNGVLQTNQNGQMELVVYDAVKNKKTLANQSLSMSVPIEVQENILFKGKASVVNGVFKIDFILPIQVANMASPLRICLATIDTNNAAQFIMDSIYVKYNTQFINKDTVGPKIDAFLNDPLFKKGDWAMSNSTLFLHLSDISGIQTSGNALGQDISIWMDNDPVPIILNNYFIADIDTYQSGRVQFALPTLSKGVHRIIIKAWDMYGNSNSDTLTFEVPNGQDLSIKNLFNFPNPFVEKSRFGFEINQVGEVDQIGFEVYDWAGNLLYLHQANQLIDNTKFYVDWDGETASGKRISPGVYFYRFSVKSKSFFQTLTNTFIKL